MEVGYIIKGKIRGESWKSKVFDDAEKCDRKYFSLLNDTEFSNLKQFVVYTHYEEVK